MGKPSKGTPKDMRLAANRPTPSKMAKPVPKSMPPRPMPGTTRRGR